MRINSILESINRAIDRTRKDTCIETRGHFTALTTIKKLMGPYKECRIEINYTDLSKQQTSSFCVVTCVERCASNEEHKLIEKTTDDAITEFFIKWIKCGNDIIIDGYGNK